MENLHLSNQDYMELSVLTGIRDTDVRILKMVDRRTLAVLPRVAKYFVILMNDKFWDELFYARYRVRSTGCTSKEAYYLLPHTSDMALLAYKAAKYGQIELVKRILKKKSSKKVAYDVYEAIFQTALLYENKTLFDLVIGRLRLDRTKDAKTLIVECCRGHRLMVEYLLDTRNDSDPLVQQTLLQQLIFPAMHGGNIEIVRLLVRRGLNLNYGNGRLLIDAIQRNNASLVDFLLDPIIDGEHHQGVDLTAIRRRNNDDPMINAILGGNRMIVQRLLKHLPKIRKYHLSKLLVSPYAVDLVDLFEPMLSHYVQRYPHVLMPVIKCGRVAIINYLATQGILTRHISVVQCNYLRTATIYGHTAIVRTLLATIDYSIEALEESLHYAEETNRRFIIDLLGKILTTKRP